MNLYMVVEGDGEKEVYEKWVPLVNPNLKYVSDVAEIVHNNFVIVSGGGFPNYYQKVIPNAIEDVNIFENIDRLVVSVDSEDMEREEKYNEIFDLIAARQCRAQVRIVVQHFCLEAWALGNRQIVRRNSQNVTVRNYLRFFDIVNQDPELLSPYPESDLTRSQFAFLYLKKIVNDRHPSMTYSKSNRRILTQAGYLYQIKNRLEQTGHIPSFQAFLDALV
jgi:hypothetical protein